MATPQAIDSDMTGCVLDRYQLRRLLGRGGMGTVYEAEHIALEKRVALKVLRQQFTEQEIARKRFLREARAATRVEHAHVVEISDFGETPDGQVYFVMELLEGQDLGHLLKEAKRLPWTRAKAMLVQVASALDAAHARGILHRDVKPSNCFVVQGPDSRGDDFVKVLDFGIAKFMGGTRGGEETEGLTTTGEVCGTPAYMAPETLSGNTNDVRSDIYSMGVMMYRMLTGELPFVGDNAFQILSQHINEPPPPPRSKDPSIPAGVEAIILKALAKDVRHRFQSMREVSEALMLECLPSPNPRISVVPVADEQEDKQATEVLAAASDHRVSSPQQTAKPDSSARSMLGEARHSAAESDQTVVIGLTEVAVPTARPAYVNHTGPSATVVAREHWEHGLSYTIEGPTNALGRSTPTIRHTSRTLSRALILALVVIAFASMFTVGLYLTKEPGGVEVTAAPASASTELSMPEPTPPAQIETPTRRSSDARVIAQLRREIVARCRVNGTTTVQLEGLINAEGGVLGAMATPQSGPGACADALLQKVRFSARANPTLMPAFTVDL